MEIIDLIKNNKEIIIVILVIFLILYICQSIRKNIRRVMRKHVNNILYAKGVFKDTQELINAVKEAQEEVTPKSIGGLTDIYLKNINEDFPNFHNQDAESAIRTLIIEFLNIRYGKQQDFEKSSVNNKLLLNIQKEGLHNISNITINKIAIYDYNKTVDYATINYKCSFGYDLDGKRKEERYSIDYTLQLSNNDSQSAMVCENCGGVLSVNDKYECPWCGAKIIMDTIMNWNFTELTEC